MSRAQLDDLDRRIAAAMDHHGLTPQELSARRAAWGFRNFAQAASATFGQMNRAFTNFYERFPQPKPKLSLWRGLLVIIPVWVLLCIHTACAWIAELSGNLFDSLLDWAGYEL